LDITTVFAVRVAINVLTLLMQKGHPACKKFLAMNPKVINGGHHFVIFGQSQQKFIQLTLQRAS